MDPAALLGATAALVRVPPLRRRLLTRPLLRQFRRVMPPLSPTEQEAIEAGGTWWDAELFSGRPRWDRLLGLPPARLSPEEETFLAGPVDRLCRMLDDWRITHEDLDLPPEVWALIRRERLFGLVIPKAYGGLGFSHLAHSQIVLRLASRSVTAAVTVMVPNSLGPAELLLRYGTEAQRRPLPAASGPRRGDPLLRPHRPPGGSDAASIPDIGVVCPIDLDGKRTLGIRLDFEKRYITLGPVATLIGLAFRLRDPDRLLGGDSEPGITLALIPAATPGIEQGRRHLPLGIPFQNGPLSGHGVLIPIDWVIGGRRGHRPGLADAHGVPGRGPRDLAAGAGHRGRQIGDALHAGPMPASAASSADPSATSRASRRPWPASPGGPIRWMPRAASSSPPWSRASGPRSWRRSSSTPHRAPAPGDQRRHGHPGGQRHLPRTSQPDRTGLPGRPDRHHRRGGQPPHPQPHHLRPGGPAGPSLDPGGAARRPGPGPRSGPRPLRPGRPLPWSASAPQPGSDAPAGADPGTSRLGPRGEATRYFQRLSWLASAFALNADLTLMTLGGSLKRRERLSARLGDVLGLLFLASAVLKHHQDQRCPAPGPAPGALGPGGPPRAHPAGPAGPVAEPPEPAPGLGAAVADLPTGLPQRGPSDALEHQVARLILGLGAVRDRLTAGIHLSRDEAEAAGRLDLALEAVARADPVERILRQALALGTLPEVTGGDLLRAALEARVIRPQEAAAVSRAEALRDAVIRVDSFTELHPSHAYAARDAGSRAQRSAA